MEHLDPRRTRVAIWWMDPSKSRSWWRRLTLVWRSSSSPSIGRGQTPVLCSASRSHYIGPGCRVRREERRPRSEDACRPAWTGRRRRPYWPRRRRPPPVKRTEAAAPRRQFATPRNRCGRRWRRAAAAERRRRPQRTTLCTAEGSTPARNCPSSRRRRTPPAPTRRSRRWPVAVWRRWWRRSTLRPRDGGRWRPSTGDCASGDRWRCNDRGRSRRAHTTTRRVRAPGSTWPTCRRVCRRGTDVSRPTATNNTRSLYTNKLCMHRSK